MAFRRQAGVGPLIVVVGSSHKLKKKDVVKAGPSDKTFRIRAWILQLVAFALIAKASHVYFLKKNREQFITFLEFQLFLL